jgi:hypothetical protein
MPEQFESIAAYAQRSSALQDAARIRAAGTRRLRRHRAGQAALGTGAFALVAGLGTTLALAPAARTGAGLGAAGSAAHNTATDSNVLTHAEPSPSVGATPGTATWNVTVMPPSHVPGYVPFPPGSHIKFTRAANYYFGATINGSNGHSILCWVAGSAQQEVKQLRQLGFTHVSSRAASSKAVPVGDTVDIQDAQGRSVIGGTVTPQTPVVVVYSIG